MCFFSSSGYRPFINLPRPGTLHPSLGNLLLDITLDMFNFIPVSFCLLLILGLRLGLWLELGFRV